MKKVLAVLLLTLAAVPAMAQHYHGHGFRHHGHHGYYYGGGNGNWVAPLIIGGFVGAAIANNRQQEPIVLQQPPVVVHQQPIIVQQQSGCTAWKEIQSADGTIYRERTCYGVQQ
jgi:hypothetical protein